MSIKENFGIIKSLNTVIHKKSYKHASKTLKDVMDRKKDSYKDKLYYASQVAKSYPGVDARKLASMSEEMPANNVSGGNVAGVGVGPQGEPGVKKRKTASFIAYMRRKNVSSN